MSERVILAYSGGLDTSVAISWIGKETGREVVAVPTPARLMTLWTRRWSTTAGRPSDGRKSKAGWQFGRTGNRH